MPLYRFVCSVCHHEESLLLKINEEVPPCSKCGGELVKQISKVVSFKSGSNLKNNDVGSRGSSCSGCSGGSCSSCGG
ncbi:MAG: zinc ribbon domain-containing protein [Thermotogae bacterium]|uniref:FmdB family zinc ribbon protein n=1 Tax=Kosmotoga sp. TaxID=1955248 RepID=UPI000F1F9183|nr:zinc ribbon domain-containing protein [Kosmotoga sp.]MCD6159314.1 zinc ribbon domain-containing protein [Kosmotoga sp.]RKX48253.1 MAG: zinc ribbon domain-containing protein [Thermotogota bacterium]